MPNKLLAIQPQQFDLLLSDLAAKTPPKEKTLYTLRDVVERLYDFVTQSLANHYSYDELAVMIEESLASLALEEDVPEIRGGTLKKYYLEVKREKESNLAQKGARKSRRQRSGTKKSTTKTVTGESPMPPQEKRSETPKSDSGEGAKESAKPMSGSKKLPRPDSAGIKLAY
ncbi:MAG: hypothetical protein IGR76_10435 [Synechococcales cyanobacterium T60_A2020_003]|nr:hypothetical protein [Synechococcales cyanobacterium T60_A2020_003]